MRSSPRAGSVLLLVWLPCLLLLCPGSAFSEPEVSDDALLDTILASQTVAWSQAAWLVGRASGAYDDSTTVAEASRRAQADGTIPRGIDADSPIDAAGFAWLLSRSLNLGGGVMATLFPGPRYAFRELIYRRILPADEAPDGRPTGQELLIYLQNAQTWKEAHP